MWLSDHLYVQADTCESFCRPEDCLDTAADCCNLGQWRILAAIVQRCPFYPRPCSASGLGAEALPVQ